MPIRKIKYKRRRKRKIVLTKHGQKKTPNVVATYCHRPIHKHIIVDINKRGARIHSPWRRLLSPYNKFKIPQVIQQDKSPQAMLPENKFKKTGLSPKEKSFLICTFQNKTTRYARIKAIATDAIKKRKIFFMRTPCKPIRDALVERGWVEKIPPERMDISKIRNKHYTDGSDMHTELEKILYGHFVEKCHPTFVWNAKDDYDPDKYERNFRVIHSRLHTYPLWTSKQGLCASMKTNHWYYIEDVSEINSPRTYTSFDTGEKDDFEKDYKLTACTSLLKWVLSMAANDRPIFGENGNIAINVIVFALNRCKEYLFYKQNKDIDKFSTSSATVGQWKAFLNKYYMLIAKEDIFKIDKEKKVPLYLGYAKCLLKEIHKYRPQLSCEGCHNIWIIKPAHCSRGRGIRMASKFAVLTDMINRGKYVFQKYIEEPLLIHETKFDIRQYYLISSTYPLVIWMYKDCYLKFSSQNYSLKSFHESIHLTNNAVQKRYKNCEGRHSELPKDNMWGLNTYKEYLNRIGKEDVWETIIYPGMKKSIVGTMLSCQDSMTNNKWRFELYGCDFILDKDYKPWLIEINSSPDLNPTTHVTAQICPDVLRDIIKVVIDRLSNPKASTGNFECIYRQVLTTPQYATADLAVRGYALPLDYFYRGNILLDDSISKSKIEKQADITAMLRKLKKMHDTDIMKDLDSTELEAPQSQRLKNQVDSSTTSDEDRITVTQQTTCKASVSDEDLNAVVTVITEQLDSLLSRIPSRSSSSRNFQGEGNSVISVSYSNSFEKKELINVGKSEFHLNKIFDKTIKRFASTQNIKSREPHNLNRKKSFCFSHLDDGPDGKGSGLACQYMEQPPDMDYGNYCDLKITDSGHKDKTLETIREASRKIMLFLERKEKEYKKKKQKYHDCV